MALQPEPYEELGRKTYAAFSHFLESLSSARIPAASVSSEVKETLNRIESKLAELEERLRTLSSRLGELSRASQPKTEQIMPQQLPKDVTRQKALQAGLVLQKQGERVTMAAVAREAGLKYSQMTYAFGGLQEFLGALDEYKVKQKNRG